MMKSRTEKGFTLVETLVAISLLTIAIVAPMSLTTQSLTGAFYARDQVTAFYLAQEALEAVRSVRDGNILKTALGTPTPILAGIAIDGSPFTVDTRTFPATISACSGVCPSLKTDGTFYGYDPDPSWKVTNFIRTVRAVPVAATGGADEVRVSVTVTWYTTPYNSRSFTLSDNLYAWVGSGT